MYWITEMLDKTFYCEVRIQDGTERWSKPSLKQAIRSVIQAARTLNGTYISEDDISVGRQVEAPQTVATVDELKLLNEIKSGHKKVLPYDDPRLKYRITPKECELIQRIREGEVEITSRP